MKDNLGFRKVLIKQFAILLLFITLASCILLPQEQGYIVPGIHEEYLPQPIYYETFIPILLEYQTPKWNKTEVTFNNWYTCLTETSPYRYSCPVVFHMNQAMLNLHVDFEGLHPVVDSQSAALAEASHNYYDKLITSSEFCSKIQKHFSSIWTRSSDLEAYIQALDNCQWDSGLGPLVERSISDFNYSVRLPFTRMENNFYHTFYKLITASETANTSASGTTTSTLPLTSSTPNGKLDLVASALLSNARTTLQSSILGVYYAEKNRWIHANQDCLLQLIPQSIVTKAKFSETLSKIQDVETFKGSNDLSIALGAISKYYSLPLTDCTHTSSDTLAVRILIPILKKNRAKSLQLIHIHNIPFEYKGHVCSIKLNSIMQQPSVAFVNNIHNPSHYLYEELSGSAYPTDCQSNELCKLSEYDLNPRNSDLCASALISRNHSAILSQCRFQCKKEDIIQNPLVTRIHSNQYIITGSPLQFTIKCKGQSDDQIVNIDSEQIGSHMINLPCNCLISLPKNNIFYGEGPCTTNSNSTSLSVIPIIPFHFGRMKPSTSNRNAPSVNDLFYYENVPEGRLVNLADFVDLQRIDEYIKSSTDTILYRKSGGGSSGSSVGTGNGDSEAERLTYKSDSGSVGILWVVFVITSLILFSIQIYILYLIRRGQRVSYPKDDQILYRVPDSPVNY